MSWPRLSCCWRAAAGCWSSRAGRASVRRRWPRRRAGGLSLTGAGPRDREVCRARARVIRVRDGDIVCYDGYMDPIALARLLGRTGELAAALTRA